MKKNSEHAFSKNKGFKILGIGKQDAIKYFFGGNALVSIIVLILITVFLGKEAMFFFPDYKESLTIYRKSGKEFADHADLQLDYQKLLKSLTTQSKQYELFHRAGIDAYVPKLYSAIRNVVSEELKTELLSIKISKERISGKEFIWEIWMDDPEKKDLAIQQKEEYFNKLQATQADLTEKIKQLVPNIRISDLTPEFQKIAYKVRDADSAMFGKIQDSIILFYSNYSKSTKLPTFISDSQELSNKKQAELASTDFFKNMTKQEQVINTWIGETGKFDSFVQEVREQTLLVSARSEAYLTAADRKKAIEEGIPEATEEKKKSLMVDLERLITEEQDYDLLAEKVYARLPKHKLLTDQMVNETAAALASLPPKSDFTNRDARRIKKELEEAEAEYKNFMAKQRSKMENWRHDEKVGWIKTGMGFFFGKNWVANSSWQNFFGLAPLFGGSLFITLIAICIATPFAVGGAIYVNRLASPLEQTIVKPIIEFIQAIPSVVLAFLGIVVVGKTILSLSYKFSWWPWLEDQLGFPASGEQMMLTAGILLAFMAIPTMFTLAEDAINNVPKSFNEASLALGATKLQTVFKVIVPCSLSGVVAAVLLGFGRIIGETMVVLLVAGGRTDWPSALTSPVHTMTGIIAQSTGEAAPGSIQFRALFLVGLVLFCISLLLNSLAQNVIKKFGNNS